MTGTKECILYRDFEHGEILELMTELMGVSKEGREELKLCGSEFFQCVNQLVELAGAYGFSGNLSAGKPRECFQYFLRNCGSCGRNHQSDCAP